MKENGVIYTPTEGTTVSLPEPGMQRQVLVYNPNLTLVRHHFLKGWECTSHNHPHQQLVYVVAGRLQFVADGKTIELHTATVSSCRAMSRIRPLLWKTLRYWTCLLLVAKTARNILTESQA